jgi:hypothetical protein
VCDTRGGAPGWGTRRHLFLTRGLVAQVGYQKASVATEAISAQLNAGQAVVLALGLTSILLVAALTTPVGRFTAGDLVSPLLLLPFVTFLTLLAVALQQARREAEREGEKGAGNGTVRELERRDSQSCVREQMLRICPQVPQGI